MRSTRTIVFGCALIAVALVFWGILRAIKQSNPQNSAPNVVAQNASGSSSGNPSGNATNASVRSSGNIAYAATDIPAGSIVTKEMLQMKPNNGPSTTGFITDPEAQAEGFITRVPIPAGAQIRPADDFIGHISQVGIAGALQPGMRAFVLPLPSKPTLHDLVKIGNTVDVLASFDGQEARVIAQNMRVLAVDVFANDFPQVNAAMRGPYKADAAGRGIGASPAAPGASDASAGAAPDSVEPSASPTPIPANAPKPDPSITLEVTPQQAAAIQLALASNAPIDFLVRPALPGNRTGEVTLVGDNGDDTTGESAVNGVTKRQIAPYAEAVKNAGKTPARGANGGSGDGARTASSGSSSGGNASRASRFPMPAFPDVTTTKISSGDSAPAPVAPMPIMPAPPSNAGNSGSNGEFGGSGGNSGGGGNGGGSSRPTRSTYQIPIYSDGGVVRTETVPVPSR